MSTLTLKITADDTGLAEIKAATAELKQLLGTSKVPSLDAIRNLTVAVKGLETITAKAKATNDAINGSLTKTAKVATDVKKSVDLTSASYAKLSKITEGYATSIAKNSSALRNNLKSMAEMTRGEKKLAQNMQATSGIVTLLNKEFEKQVSIRTFVRAKTDKQVLSEKNLTQALLNRYVAEKNLTKAEAVKLGSTNELHAAELKRNSSKEAEILASKRAATALKAESAAALSLVKAKTLALQIATSSTSTVSPQATLGLQQQALQAANAAASIGALSRAEVEAIAVTNGLASSLTTRLNPALKKTTASSSTLRDVTRGAAGAGGSLWMAYGQILPLMGAFVTVATAIKGVGMAAEYEAQTLYMVSLAEATEDYSMSLKEVRSKLLGMRGLTDGPAELANAAKELVKAGFTSAQATKEIADMSKTAYVAQEKLEVVTRGVAAQFRAWGVASVGAARGVSSLKEAANIMGYVALTTALDFGELNAMLAHTTELGPLTGATFVEMTALLGYMSNMGITGTKAATSMRTGMLKLQNVSDDARMAMSGLRVEFSHLTKDGQLKSLSTMFEDLGKSLKPLTIAARMELMDKIFTLKAMKGGTMALRALAESVDDGTFSFRGLMEGAKKAGEEMTFIDGMFDRLSDSSKQLFAILKADAASEMVSAFEGSNSAMKGLLSTMQTMVDDGSFRSLLDILAGMTEQFINLVKWALKYKEALMAVAAGFVAGKAVLGILKIVGAIKLAIKAGKLFTAVTLANPWVLGAAAIAAGVVYVASHLGKTADVVDELNAGLDKSKRTIGVYATDLYNLKETANEKLSKDSWVYQLNKATGGFDKQEFSMEGMSPSQKRDAQAFLKALSSGSPSSADTTKPDIAGGDKGGTDTLITPEQQKFDEWKLANTIKIERAKIAATAKLRAEGDATELSLLNASYKARQTTEQEFFSTSRRLASEDLSKRITEAGQILELDRARAIEAKAFASTQKSSTDAGLAAAKAYESAQAKVVVQEDKLLALKAKQTATGPLFKSEDLTRQQAVEKSLYGLVDANQELLESTQDLASLSIMDEGDIRRAEASRDLTREKANALRDLNDRSIATDSAEYMRTVKLYDDKAILLKAYYEEEAELRASGLAGAQKSMADYLYAAEDMNGMVKGATDNAFQGMEDALVTFVETGKLSFKDLANSIISDITRIMAKKAIAGLVGAIFGATTGSTDKSIVNPDGTVGDVVKSAKGNVFSSPSLSAYSGTIVDSPTFFANGGSVMGEAGPEAILPLERGPGGKLGITAAGVGGESIVINQYINVDATGEQDIEARISQAVQDGSKRGYDLVLRDFRTRGPAYQGARA